MKILKHQLQITDLQEIMLPLGYEILSIQVQKEVPCIWYKCDPEQTFEVPLLIAMYATGQELLVNQMKYFTTYQLEGGNLVFHVYIL